MILTVRLNIALPRPRAHEQKFSIYEVYLTRERIWKQKVMRTRPLSQMAILQNELKQMQDSHKNQKDVFFEINVQGARLRV